MSVVSCIVPFWTYTGQQDGKLAGLLPLTGNQENGQKKRLGFVGDKDTRIAAVAG